MLPILTSFNLLPQFKQEMPYDDPNDIWHTWKNLPFQYVYQHDTRTKRIRALKSPWIISKLQKKKKYMTEIFLN